MSVFACEYQVSVEAKGICIPGAGVTGDHEPPIMDTGNTQNSGPLHEQCVLLSTELSFQLPVLDLLLKTGSP